ncbi:MAG: helicase C-terminal domain-containing protein [Candidatus Bathyarchaeota archaeon]|jgi:Rad3-related DNA helicase
MPTSARCPVCERSHTLEEYEGDRFCRTCGAHLRLDKAGVGNDWRDFFPYDPYPQQVEFMEDVERFVCKGQVLIAEACNGFGKTSSCLAALLPSGKPIVYATRTHEQVRQVLMELSTINDVSGERFTSVNLASRLHLCINPECQDLPPRDGQELCRNLRETGECPWESNIASLPKGLPPIMTQKVLISVGKGKMICPYYLARKAASHCRVVVVPYPYVFDQNVRSSVGLELTGRLLVLDEAHNLDKVGQDALSDTLSEFALDLAAEELKAVRASTTHVRRLARLLREKTGNKPTLVSADTLERDLELALAGEIEMVVERYMDAVEKIRAHKMRLGDPPSSYLNGMLVFLSLVLGSDKGKYIAIYHRSRRGGNALDYRCLDPSLAVQPVVDSAFGALVMSGTLSPMDLFAEVVGIEDAEKRAYPAIQDPDNIRMRIDPRVTSTYRERTREMLLKIGRRLASELVRVRNGALIFFPQRGFMDNALDIWGAEGIIDVRGGQLYLGDKLLYIEGNSASQNRGIVKKFKQSAVTNKGAVLCCVFRGRNAEGSNFPGAQARGIFLVGVPYANYGDPLIRAQIGYYNRRGEGLGRRWYTMDAFRAANQALGRGIRNLDDWCHYWLLDHRYADGIDFISKWALGSGPEIIAEQLG